MTWKEFAQHNIDKVILLILLHGMGALMLSSAGNPSLTEWLRLEVGTVLGALLMLITGRNAKPDPTITAQTVTTQSVTVPPVVPEAPKAG